MPHRSHNGRSAPAISTPLVSVLIPYYNQQRFIRDAVLSVKRQAYKNIEIIIVDDESPTPAEPYLRGIDGIHIFRTRNRGASVARNFAFEQSSGRFLIFLDGDDLLTQGAIQAHLRVFTADPEIGFSFGPAGIIDEHGVQVRPPRTCRPRKDYYLMFLEMNPICSLGATMISRDAFIEVGMFDERLAGQVGDYDLYLRLAERFRVMQHAIPVMSYRRHSGNNSSDLEMMLRGTLELFDKVETTTHLNPAQHKRLRYGRKRWIHAMRPKDSMKYRLRNFYYKLRTIADIPLRAYFRELVATIGHIRISILSGTW